MSLNTNACRTCKFWLRAQNDLSGKSGVCRRNPPQVIAVPDRRGSVTMGSAFPVIGSDGWCGEYRLLLEVMADAKQ